MNPVHKQVGLELDLHGRCRKMSRISRDLITEDLIEEILLWLPVKSLVRFQSVSKSWGAPIRDPKFIKLHLERSIQTLSERIFVLRCSWDEYCLVKLNNEGWFDKPLKVVQSSSIPKWLRHISNHCNGLFCGHDNENGIVIWNPSIRKHKTIPPMKRILKPLFNVGIGYDLINDDYKVVNIVQLSTFRELVVVSDVLVYSLKESSWRRVEDKWPFKDFIPGVGTYLNGNMHWVVETEGIPYNRTVLVAFDLTKEKFQVHPFPMESLSGYSLKVLGGRLCACTDHEIWMMEDYGVASSWSLLYTHPTSSNRSLLFKARYLRLRPLVISENGQEILMEASYEHYWYDRVKQTQQNVKVLDMSGDFWATPSQGSLVLINGDNDDSHNITIKRSSLRFFRR